MRRFLGIAGISVLILVLTCAGIVYSWTFTPHGRLDVEVAVILKLMPRMPPPGSVPAAQMRQGMRDATIRFQGRPVPILHVEDRSIPGPLGSIPIRVYRPSDETKLPIVVYYHGGGFTTGDLDTHDGLCRRLSKRSGAIVVSVAYRLAPEHVFPAAVEDAYAALEWAAQKGGEISGDPSRIAVAGDSAGGDLAAVMALKSRDLNGPKIALQVLYYPGTNMTDLHTKSMEDFAEGYLLTRAQLLSSYNQYVPAVADRSNPYASPLLAPDHRGLPPALIITAGFDPLRDSGEAYARKLADAGVATRLSRYEGVVHSFLSCPFVRKADRAIDESTAALREAFGRNSP
jgi:acetyl esterase